jgi:peptidyl-prolyl cis-trans isomerase B (cyclophilin B)
MFMKKGKRRKQYTGGKPADLHAKALGYNQKTKGFPVALLLVTLAAVIVGGLYVHKRLGGSKTLEAGNVLIETNKGDIEIELYPDLAPITVANFVKLAKEGFYDGLIWHRVENWVVQTGDPEGTGYGGSDETINLEINENLKNVRGAVGMARSQDPNSASSQFYILKTDARSLDGQYAVFGQVVSGMDVIDRLVIGDKMIKVTLGSQFSE